jgi:hypothetical protein
MAGQGSIALGMALAAVALVPGLSEAAGATAVFGEAVPVMEAGRAIIFGAATVGTAWLGYRTIKEVATNRQDGEWMSMGIYTCVAAVLGFVIVPRMMAPGLALAATPEMMTAAVDLLPW